MKELMAILAEDKWHILGCELLTYDSLSSMKILFGCREGFKQHTLSPLTDSNVEVVYKLIGDYNLRKYYENISRKEMAQ